MTQFTISISDFFKVAGKTRQEDRIDLFELEGLVRSEFAFLGRPLEVEIHDAWITISFREETPAVAEAKRLAKRAAKRANEGHYEKAISIWKRANEIRHHCRRKNWQKTWGTVRPKRLALLQAGSMAVAVLTPRNNDLESGTWTRAAPLSQAQ